MQEADIILATLTDRVTISRANPADPMATPQILYQDLPCALSRTAMVTAPNPHDPMKPLAECSFRATLFLPAHTWTKTGDQAEVLRQGMRFSGVLSPGIPYPSHTVAVMHVWEVTPV